MRRRAPQLRTDDTSLSDLKVSLFLLLTAIHFSVMSTVVLFRLRIGCSYRKRFGINGSEAQLNSGTRTLYRRWSKSRSKGEWTEFHTELLSNTPVGWSLFNCISTDQSCSSLLSALGATTPESEQPASTVWTISRWETNICLCRWKAPV